VHGYTGEPSRSHQIVALGAKALKKMFAPVGGVLAVVPLKIPFLTDGVPPFFLKYGLVLTDKDFDGLPVRVFTPPEPSGKVVVAIHGGSYAGEATIFHWWTYTDLARQTGATVVVPDYALTPVGTADTEVPRVADFIADAIGEHGDQNVSVLGDSAGGGLALLAVQELVRRGSTRPSRLVLLAPWLDVSMSDDRLAGVDDPLLDVANSARYGRSWAGERNTRDPLVSPLFGSLDGLPPTFVYSSSRDLLTIDALRLRERALAEGVSQIAFRMRQGLLHDYPIYAPLSDARAERPHLYGDLDLGSAPHHD
jgi:triacylglycerol lipase